MSWGTCYSGSNNIHFEFPPIMSDGRNYSSWQPGSVLSNEIKKRENITKNWQYRKYMTDNANLIIESNQINACESIGGCVNFNTGVIPNTPYLFSSCLDDAKPFGYESSDLKTNYLKKYQFGCKMVAPVIYKENITNM